MRFASTIAFGLLTATTALATGDHFNKNNNNNNNNEVDKHHHDHQEQRVFRQVRHSPFQVYNSKDLNNALAILEHESQNWHEHSDKNWWNWEEKENFEGKSLRHNNNKDNDQKWGHHTNNNNNNNNRAAANNRNNKHGHEKKEREHFFGRIEILKEGDYYLKRDYIFADGFKLILQGLPHHKTKTYGDTYAGATVVKTGTTYPAGAVVSGNDYNSVGSATAIEKVPESLVVIHAAKNQRHFIFDDQAILKASDITFVKGGCEKEGFFGGSMLFMDRASGWFEHVTFKDNTAWVGGAIFAQDAAHLDFHECKFVKNHAERRGGAVAIEEEREEKKHGKGDKVAARNQERNNRKSKTNNKNTYNRALYFEDHKEDEDFVSTRNNNRNNRNNKDKQHHDKKQRITRVHFFKCLFFHNSADLGGALFNAGSRTEVVKSHFTANHARLGGAVFNSHMGRLLVRESSFHANKASAKGGAIFNAGRLWIVCSRFSGNQAPIGCDIFNNGELKCTSSTLPVQVEGHGEGYCMACVRPAVAKPTYKSVPKRRVKKAKNDKKEEKKGGLGGLFAGHGHGKEDNEEEYFYGYAGSGPSVYDKFNGYGYGHAEGDKKGNTYSYGAYGSGSDWEGGDYYSQGGSAQGAYGDDDYYYQQGGSAQGGAYDSYGDW